MQLGYRVCKKHGLEPRPRPLGEWCSWDGRERLTRLRHDGRTEKCHIPEGPDSVIVNEDEYWICGHCVHRNPDHEKIKLHSIRQHVTCEQCGQSRLDVKPVLHVICMRWLPKGGPTSRCGWTNLVGNKRCRNPKCRRKLPRNWDPVVTYLNDICLIKHESLGGPWLCTRCIDDDWDSLNPPERETCKNSGCEGTLAADGLRAWCSRNERKVARPGKTPMMPCLVDK